MLRRGIKRVAGRQTDIGYRPRSILLIEPGRGIMPVANRVAVNTIAAWLEAGESDPTGVLTAVIAGRDTPSAPSPPVITTVRASIAKYVCEK